MRKLHKMALTALSTCHGNVTGKTRQITKSQNKHCPAVSTLQASDPTVRTLLSATAALSSRPCGWQLAHFQGWDWTLLWTGFPQTTPYPVWGNMHFCIGNSPLKHPAAKEGHREAVSSYMILQVLEILHPMSHPWQWRSFPPILFIYSLKKWH